MFQVLNLPYLLQSLVPTKGAICVQPRPRGTVHHYPSHCKSRDRSSTAGSARTEYQCAPKNNASYEVSQCDTRNDAGNASYEVSQCDTRNNAGYGVAQCAARNDAGYGGMQRAAIAVKQEPVYGVPQCAANPTDAGRYGVGTGIPVQSIKTEGKELEINKSLTQACTEPSCFVLCFNVATRMHYNISS